MACEVKTFGKIRDFKKVQEYFGLGHDDNWLNSINHAISPTGEVIALAQGEKIALLSTSWDTRNANTYSLRWCAELEDPNQIITSVTCLPMYGRSVSSGAEWTAVVLGLNSGMVVFYTDTGIKLFSQCCQEDPVLAVKVHTPSRYTEAEPMLYIIYDQCVCMLKGEDTFPLLLSLRHNASRSLERNQAMQLPLATLDIIPFHKYKFAREREMIVNDAVIAATQRPCTYDHIVAQSVGFGYFSKINSISAQSSQVVAAGAEPFLGFYYAEEGYKLASIGEVAKDVIGMAYKNLLGGLFRLAPEPPPSPADELPSPAKEAQMRTRCHLYDGKRDGFSIAIAPGGQLAALTDNLDRVMLVDTKRAIILRVWKGYRDAQCAFVPVKEKSLKGVKTHRRRALFLVIYAPRLGCLDIWALQNGPKVAAFTVCKSGQLSYNTHGLLGVQSTNKYSKTHISFCLFLDPSDSSVKEVHIPFHYALSETNSQTSRDIHMLRRLRNSLRSMANSPKSDLSEIAKLAGEFQTNEVRQQLLEILLNNRQLRPQVFQCIMHALDEQLAMAEQPSEEQQHFQQLVTNYKRLVDFYIALRTPQQQQSDYKEDLELYDCDLVIINQLVILLSGSDEAKTSVREVKFEAHCEVAGDFIDYLSVFDVEGKDSLRLKRSKSDSYGQISNIIFDEFLEHGLCFEQFKRNAEAAFIPCSDLLVLAMHYWLDKPFKYKNCDHVVEDMSRLAAMIRAICELEGEHINDYAYNSISPWWQEVREMLLESKKCYYGLLVAIVCKTVAVQLWRSNRDASCDESSQNEEEERWERISHDEAEWGLLIGKLEDVAVLGAILEHPITSVEPVGPETPYERPDCSLKFIVNGGKGIVTDLAAKWLISTRIDPSKLLELRAAELEPEKYVEAIDKSAVENELEKPANSEPKQTTINDPVLEKLTLLRTHFPFSLESGVLLSLMSWHYMVYWSKNLSSLEHMRAAVNCLEQFKIEDWALKHGMCCMLWNATLKFPLQSTMKLMQKVGRLPVDKMCQQDIEISAGLVPDFLELSLKFLHNFRTSLEHDKRELKFEESLSVGPLPLQFIALQQHHAIKELLQLHYEVCTVLHFIAFFQLKFTRPLTTLFDAMSNKAFQADINKELPFILPAPDLVLQQQRTEFLCKVVTATMDLIRQDLQQLYILDHVYYMSQICALADSWRLDKLPILRRQVVELYAYGYDTEAQVLLADVMGDEELGRLLLEISGRRMNLYAETTQEYFLKIASVGRQLLQYLDHLKENNAEGLVQITATKPDEIDFNAMIKLVTHAYKCLSRHETRYIHIAGQMYDACRLLQE